MQSKFDPYATRSTRAGDLLLILFALLAILLAVWTSPRHQSDADKPLPHPNPTLASR